MAVMEGCHLHPFISIHTSLFRLYNHHISLCNEVTLFHDFRGVNNESLQSGASMTCFIPSLIELSVSKL